MAQVEEESKVRWAPAPDGIEAYAAAFCERCLRSNPFSPIDESSFAQTSSEAADRLQQGTAGCCIGLGDPPLPTVRGGDPSVRRHDQSQQAAAAGGSMLTAFKEACARAVAVSIRHEGRWVEGQGVCSPYTVFHVVARLP